MAGFIGDLINQLGGGGDERAMDIYKDLARQAQNIPLPVLKEYYPELYKQVAQYMPEAESAQTLGPSSMESISVDPRLREAQMNALLKLQEIGDAGGMTASDKARLAQIQSEQEAALKGQTGAIQQNLATRGMSGGMSELVARQMAAQQGANRMAQQGLDVKAQAEQRALDAIMKSGQLGGQMSAQEFGQAADIAKAKDMINQFNTSNLQAVQSRNVGARNVAGQQQAQTAQQIAQQNVGLKNEAQIKNQSLAQQEYENRLRRQGLLGSAMGSQAQAEQQGAAGQRQFIGGLVGSGAMAYGGGK